MIDETVIRATPKLIGAGNSNYEGAGTFIKGLQERHDASTWLVLTQTHLGFVEEEAMRPRKTIIEASIVYSKQNVSFLTVMII